MEVVEKGTEMVMGEVGEVMFEAKQVEVVRWKSGECDVVGDGGEAEVIERVAVEVVDWEEVMKVAVELVRIVEVVELSEVMKLVVERKEVIDMVELSERMDVVVESSEMMDTVVELSELMDTEVELRK